MRRHLTAFLCCLLCAMSVQAVDLPEIRARGELRHLGVRFANFVTGSGDGFDVELVRGFAEHLGVRYTLVYSDFYVVMRDLLGKEVVRENAEVRLEGDYPVKGDIIAAGFTVLPWREQVLLFSAPTFPSQVLLVARTDSELSPIKAHAAPGADAVADVRADIKATKALIGKHSLLIMEGTSLDPGNYGLSGKGLDLRAYTRSSNPNEMVPALLEHGVELTLLDVADVILDLRKWAGRIKVLGPVSEQQLLAAAFSPDSPQLRAAFDDYLRELKRDGRYDALVDHYYPGIRRYFPAFFAGYE